MNFNEYMTMISAYILVSLALISQSGIIIGENIQLGDPDLEYKIGNVLIFIILLQILINISWILVKGIYDGYRKY
jgi:hypothetical protein